MRLQRDELIEDCGRTNDLITEFFQRLEFFNHFARLNLPLVLLDLCVKFAKRALQKLKRITSS